MLIVCWSAKGGSGATTVATSLVLHLAPSHPSGVVLVDLAGDVPAALGVAEVARPGVSEWLAGHPRSDADSLNRLAIDVLPGVALVPLGLAPLRSGPAMEALAVTLATLGRPVVVDAGTVRPGDPQLRLVAAASSSLLVLRPCYLALRRAAAMPVRPSAVVLVDEPGRALGKADVEAVLGVPVRAQIPSDPAVARALDAGLLASRVPRSLARAVRAAA